MAGESLRWLAAVRRHLLRHREAKEKANKTFRWVLANGILATACFGGMLFGWDIGAIGGILTIPAFTVYILDSCNFWKTIG